MTRLVYCPGVCRECGCDDEHACPGGCSWVEPDLCSACVFAGDVDGITSDDLEDLDQVELEELATMRGR